MSGSVTLDHIDIQDDAGNCSLAGTSSGSKYYLFYDDNPDPVMFRIKGDTFRGCDQGSSFGFSGKVQNGLINLYDCESGLSFRFRV